MNNKKWGFWILTMFVVGNMVGGGIFMLPANLAGVSSPLGASMAWILTGAGVLMVALVFGNLAIRKPELKTGPQSYAQAMFKSPKKGKIAGYSIAWGYWAANWAATASVIISFAGYLSTFFPIMQSQYIIFSSGNFDLELGKFLNFMVCTVMLWGIHFILVKSFNSAGKINLLATITKVIGFALFIVVTIFIFDSANIMNGKEFIDAAGTSYTLGGQINNAAIATLWAFIGVEAAVMLSNRAKSQADVKKATITGLIIAIAIYIGITLLTMGALPQETLQQSHKPLVDALQAAIGSNGAYVLGFLALISLFGSTVGWIVVSSEVPYQAAKSNLFPAFFGKTNKKGSPVNSLTITNLLTQFFLFATVSGTIMEAYEFAMVVATLAYLIPYFVSVLYQVKLIITGETYSGLRRPRLVDGMIAALALFYTLWVIKTGTADLKTFSLGIGLFVLGVLLYPILMKNKKPKEISRSLAEDQS